MPYSIMAQDLPTRAQNHRECLPHFVPLPIGMRQDLIRKICEVVPFADFTDPAWGSIDGPDFWIEVNMGQDPVTCCSFDLRGSDRAIAIVADILSHLGLRALDTSESGVFNPESARKEMKVWRAYRAQVLGD